MKKIDNVLDVLLWSADQAHVWHLQTESKTAHGILGDFYAEVREDMDEIAETYMAETGAVLGSKARTPIKNLTSPDDITELFEKTCMYLRDVRKELDGTSTARCVEDLIDDIVAMKYKLRFIGKGKKEGPSKKAEEKSKEDKPKSKSYLDKILNK